MKVPLLIFMDSHTVIPIPFPGGHKPCFFTLDIDVKDGAKKKINRYGGEDSENTFSEVIDEILLEGFSCGETEAINKIQRLRSKDCTELLDVAITAASKETIPRGTSTNRFLDEDFLDWYGGSVESVIEGSADRASIEKEYNKAFRKSIEACDLRVDPRDIWSKMKVRMDAKLGKHKFYSGDKDPQEFMTEQAKTFQHPENENLEFQRAMLQVELHNDKQRANLPPLFTMEELIIQLAEITSGKRGGIDGKDAKQIQWLRKSKIARQT